MALYRFALGICGADDFVLEPLPVLIDKFNADDMYYYLTIARQINNGHGIPFDGIYPTNGLHPLYLLIFVGIDALTRSVLNLKTCVALALLALANLGTGVVLNFWARWAAS